jgi:tRNA(Arg) A34 adenosine deaminase TadA
MLSDGLRVTKAILNSNKNAFPPVGNVGLTIARKVFVVVVENPTRAIKLAHHAEILRIRPITNMVRDMQQQCENEPNKDATKFWIITDLVSAAVKVTRIFLKSITLAVGVKITLTRKESALKETIFTDGL